MRRHPRRDDPLPDEPTVPCNLCDRPFDRGRLSRHHCKPRSRGGKPEDIALICPQCHQTVHALFTNDTLDAVYSTIAKLREAPELESYLKWVRKQPPTRVTKSRTKNFRY